MSTNEELAAQIHLLRSYLRVLVPMLPEGPRYNDALAAVSRRFLETDVVGLGKEAREDAIKKVSLP